jgi:hypothetical protein
VIAASRRATASAFRSVSLQGINLKVRRGELDFARDETGFGQIDQVCFQGIDHEFVTEFSRFRVYE